MSSYRAALIVVCAGLLTFGIVYTLLEVSRSAAAPSDVIIVPSPSPAPIARPTDAVPVDAGERVVAVPVTGSESLLRGVQPGDRLDILASLSSPDDGRPVTSVAVRGATVVRPPSGSDPLLLQVSPPDAIALAHLVLGGTKLGFTLWPQNASPPPPQPMDERTARILLGLASLATPTAVAPAPTSIAPAATAPPTPTPVLDTVVGAFIYQTQNGDTWDSVASTFKITPNELRQWNNAASNATLDPGALLVVPRKS
jgi:LysM repeat protein